jgi:hypothetical protein
MRRMFWLGVGAAAGVSGYRKAVSLGRALSPGRSSVRSGLRAPVRGAREVNAQAARGAQARGVLAVGWSAGRLVRTARAVAAFACDVSDGMRMYRAPEARHPATLEIQPDTADWVLTRAIANAGGEHFDIDDIDKDGH